MTFPLKKENRLKQADNGVWRLDANHAFAYSEGEEAEAYLKKSFTSCGDLSTDSEELQARIKDWSSEYHLSPDRANLLRPLRFEKGAPVLELGCGCGTITRYLGQKQLKVDAVEGSGTRAELARMRCAGLANVEVINANFNDLKLPTASYEAIFLIGVLEYAAMFSRTTLHGQDAAADILERLRKALTPAGVLIIGIENRLGLKYWLGATEDHYIRPDIGLYGYPDQGRGVTTFDRREWQAIIERFEGLHSRLILPFPDYKLPRVLLHEHFVRDNKNAVSLLYRMESRDPCSEWEPRDDEFMRWQGVHQSGYLEDFANSYLLCLSSSLERLDTTFPFDFVHYSSSQRKSSLRTVTEKSVGSSSVVKSKLLAGSMNGQQEPKIFQSLNGGHFVSGPLLSSQWQQACCLDDGWQSFAAQIAAYYIFLRERCQDRLAGQGDIDILPSNIILSNAASLIQNGEDGGHVVDWFDCWEIIDQEWQLASSAATEFVLFRALFWFACHNRDVLVAYSRPEGVRTVGDFVQWGFTLFSLSLQEQFDVFLQQEAFIHGEIVGNRGSLDANVLWNWPLNRHSGQNAMPVEAGAGSGDSMLNHGSFIGRQRALFKRRLGKYSYRLLNRQFKNILHSGIFAPDVYLQKNTDVNPLDTDPLVHYVKNGWRENRDPSPLFELDWYRQQYAITDTVDPLTLYLEEGWQQGHDPVRLFHTAWYATRYPESGTGGFTPLGHYLQLGWNTGKNPNPLFDSAYYLQTHADVSASAVNPLAHYITAGYLEHRSFSPFFDVWYYLEDNPAVERQHINPLEHYIEFGAEEGRSPHRMFDPGFYTENYGLESNDAWFPFVHFIDGGHLECRPHRLFDPVFYSAHYPNYSDTHVSPVLHYHSQGVEEGLYPCGEVADLVEKPLISILTPVYNTPEQLLKKCIHSVLYQAYPHWELCLVDDGSTAPHIKTILAKYAARDSRIKVKFLRGNVGISGASNSAAAMATGEYLAFLDHDDELTMDALYEVVKAINEVDPDVLYSDEDLVNLESRQQDTFFKPDFNPELLLSHNYITHFVVTRSKRFRDVGGFSAECSGAQDFDLLLKLTENQAKVHHIPRVLYHWRAHETSTSVNHEQKDYADEAGRRSLEAALARRNIPARVEPGAWKYYYRVRREVKRWPEVALFLCCTDGQSFSRWYDKAAACLAYASLEIHLILQEEQGAADVAALEDERVILHAGNSRNRAESYNAMVSRSSTEYLLFLNPSLIPESPDWVECLLEYALVPSVCGVSGYIEGGGPAALGMESAPSGPGTHCLDLRKFLLHAGCHLNSVFCSQNVWAVASDYAMVRRELFERLGGFDVADFGNVMFDVDFSLSAREAGAELVYTPYAKVHCIAPEGYPESQDCEMELQRLSEKWGTIIDRGDPYFNPGKLLAEGRITRQEWEKSIKAAR